MHPQPSPQDLADTRRAFEANEPRDLFYRAATELIALARQGSTKLSLAEALAVLLQTWNKSYYRFRRFDARHFEDIEAVLDANQELLSSLSSHTIESVGLHHETPVKKLFTAFERVLGPVGAAKCLHLLVPDLFPLWDRAIAAAYKIPLGNTGTNATRYWAFMRIAKTQCESLREQGHAGANPLKSIDEFNYCRFTQGWTSSRPVAP